MNADGTPYIRQDALVAGAGVEAPGDGRVLKWFGATISYRPGTSRFSCGPGNEKEAGAAPVCTGGVTWLPARMLAEGFGWEVSEADGEVEVWAPAGEISSVRQGIHPDRVRVVVDLTAPSPYRLERGQGQVSVLLPPGENAGATAGEVLVLEFASGLVPRAARDVDEDGWTRLTIFHGEIEKVAVFSIGNPPRIVLDFLLKARDAAQDSSQGPRSSQGAPPQPAASSKPSSESPATGAGTRPTAGAGAPARSAAPPKVPVLPEGAWEAISWPTGAGPTLVHVMAFHPVKGAFQLRPALAGESFSQRASVARIASAQGAVAAVNGGFFCPQVGAPLGMLVIDGEWVRLPLPQRPVLAVMRDGRCDIARVEVEGRASFSGIGFLAVTGLNENETRPDGLVVFTRRFGGRIPGVVGRTRLVVSGRGRVIFKETDGNDVPIPSDGMVLSGTGARAEALTRVPLGCEVKVTFRTRPEWPGLLHAVGGGPLLVACGQIVLDPAREGFRADVAAGRHARTAIGIKPDGRVVIVAAEGGRGGRGPGLTLTELAKLMLHLHCKAAMNLDGGGSTTLVVQGQVVNACADGFPRAVSNALVVVPRRPNGNGKG
ncbi:MAG: phosphodiester glycosidase family protein [Armatimonadetes bacterium]|nr:phosphodiester glycosidase family protein [Armatimonadota bacterium]